MYVVCIAILCVYVCLYSWGARLQALPSVCPVSLTKIDNNNNNNYIANYKGNNNSFYKAHLFI